MIQAIIFDIGGVLVRTGDHRHRREWEARLGLAERESEEIVFGGEMGTKAQRGDISDEALWVWVGQRLNLSQSDLAAFRRSFWAGDVLDTDLVAFIRKLRPRYQTAVISNATDGLHAALADKFHIADAFDLIVGSAVERVMKPDPEIFTRTLARLGRAPAEAVFVDDFAHNIKAARDLGLHTIHFQPGTDIPAELAQLGVTP
ncbi:MAG: HAD family phosphatase [Chloroflexi bacterium]|nr:HAD family phosphatase [Chloroflexota bacterium]